MKSSNIKEFKSPIAALLWSFTLPGFGQIYNEQYFLGIILMFWEIGINNFSRLNLSIMESFHGDFTKAHDIVHYQWGIFYPSVWCFSMWQAYNRALSINEYIEGRKNKTFKLIGLLFGFTFGMDIGIFCHFCFLPYNRTSLPLKILSSPVFSGLFIGLLFAFAGHFIEGKIKRRYEI
jgi:hypothetical protein